MKILSIETSCDETAIAILDISGPLEKPEIKVLGNTLMSQVALHEEYGGVFPALAKREHIKNLPLLLAEALKQAGMSADMPPIDYIGVTTGPGLEPALWTGIVFAKELGEKWGKPVIPVNHMEGHICSVLYGLEKPLELPALALLVSGGHTELVHVRSLGDYEIIGHTVDDAVGEAFDKVARMLGLTYPGGPKISRLAENAREKGIKLDVELPRPMIHSGDLNFSYSGLKTAVLYKLKANANGDLSEEYKEKIARAFEDSAVDVLVTKTRRALEDLVDTKTLIVAGGVSGNKYLSEKLHEMVQDFSGLTLLFPDKFLTTDNAIMIGIAGYVRAQGHPEELSTPQVLEADGNLSINSH